MKSQSENSCHKTPLCHVVAVISLVDKRAGLLQTDTDAIDINEPGGVTDFV
jgi:hypothetical protein